MTSRDKTTVLSDQTIKAVTELGGVLQQIHHRLLAEGKIIVKDGKVIFLEKYDTYRKVQEDPITNGQKKEIRN